MAWNGSNGAINVSAVKRKSSTGLGIIIGCLAAVLLFLCAITRFTFSNDNNDLSESKDLDQTLNCGFDSNIANDKIHGEIIDIETDADNDLSTDGLETETLDAPTNDVGRVVTNAFGKVFTIEAVVVPRGPRLNGKEVYRDRRLFESNAENALDGIINQQAGDMLMGDFDEKQFEQEFLQSVLNKIEISEEDNEDEVRRKLEMIELKKELYAAYKNGESIGQIVKDTRDEMNRIAGMRDNLIAELTEMKQSGQSPEDIELAYEAANRILEDKGVRPLLSPAAVREKLRAAKMRK